MTLALWRPATAGARATYGETAADYKHAHAAVQTLENSPENLPGLGKFGVYFSKAWKKLRSTFPMLGKTAKNFSNPWKSSERGAR
jgi:hypothetical protein